MKEFILSLLAIVVLSLLVEIFCPTKVMKKSLTMAFSLVVLIVVSNGIKGIFNSNKNLDLNNYTLKIESLSEDLFSTTVETTKKQIYNALETINIEATDIELDYVITELKVEFVGASVSIKNEEDKKRTMEIIKDITGLEVGDITVWVN